MPSTEAGRGPARYYLGPPIGHPRPGGLARGWPVYDRGRALERIDDPRLVEECPSRADAERLLEALGHAAAPARGPAGGSGSHAAPWRSV